MNVYDLFKECICTNYTHIENDGSYAVKKNGDTLYLFFEWSNGKTDWKNNFDFPAKPYKDMGTTWRCHRGFLRVWKSIEPYIVDEIMNPEYKRVVIVGYSHGAAIATLCHEYVWFNRPDLRESVDTYAYGCPRVFFGCMKKSLVERWSRVHIYRNLCDIVSVLPPRLFGFRDVNTVIKIGKKGDIPVRNYKLDWFNAHAADNYLYSLKRM